MGENRGLTGSHVVLPLTMGKIAGSPEVTGKPLTSGKKGSRAQGSHVVWETADQVENSIVGSRGRKTAEKRGLKVQSPSRAAGVILGVKTHKKNKYLLLSYFFFTISERKKLV